MGRPNLSLTSSFDRHKGSSSSRGRDRGAATTELVLLTPLLIAFLLVAVAFGRLATARLRVGDAAYQAARSASLARSAEEARRYAHAAAERALALTGASCAHFTVTADVGALLPGGTARVKVACTADLGLTGLPAHLTVSRTALSVIDSYRGKA
ncbi:TadE family protein [Streptomyces sp. NPDC003077]|uniref:TadE/TadG family type IV pilus assembly protein n=1 Tax=Streptomyces sp. NPDC003077 TaxID=3154443 RepID=UPI0033B97203